MKPDLDAYGRAGALSFFELDRRSNAIGERLDGRSLSVRRVMMPVFYVVTAAGLIGFWRLRRSVAARLLILLAGGALIAQLRGWRLPSGRGVAIVEGPVVEGPVVEGAGGPVRQRRHGCC
ncbi:MAG TPA: hypothetical protein VKT78_02955 [Fimbriimonadaceae bacterium]|nr:hypothetical protein [Fimbriimonadaceae bacterium]